MKHHYTFYAAILCRMGSSGARTELATEEVTCRYIYALSPHPIGPQLVRSVGICPLPSYDWSAPYMSTTGRVLTAMFTFPGVLVTLLVASKSQLVRPSDWFVVRIYLRFLRLIGPLIGSRSA
eukprot:2776649-Pyramimonas_sp.AAC.1